ncbi:MAG: 2-hydroxychromene-2-carboxylate isomerase [Gammaproteobacteria bacterium]|nr:2-hydroxychromene-2-carboxylate isomerase [Gammaproteobacteria bacterium]
MATIDFYWDIGSTNTYFALHLIRPIAAKHGARIVMRPFNLGFVFRHHDYVLRDEPAAKLRNRGRDLARWAEKYGLPFRVPDRFPIKTSRPLRGALAARELGAETPYVDAIFARYWERNDASITEVEGMRGVAEEVGLDPDAFVALCDGPGMRQALIDETQAALARGVFGAPSFHIGDELFWGKDRMEFIDDELSRLGQTTRNKEKPA